MTISIARVDLSGKVLDSLYLFHKGKIRECLRTAGQGLDLTSVRRIAVCSSSRFNAELVTSCNPQVALIRAMKMLDIRAGSLLLVGAEKFMVISFGEKGEFEALRSNSSCAAGTGSFLDQQAHRLNLSGIEELCEMAMRNREIIPDIASRCSVFAKTDLIHAQQQGHSLEAICDSLCRGLAINIADTLFNQAPPVPPVLFAGGVSKNTAVIRHLQKLLGAPLIVHEYSHCLGAIGARYSLVQEKRNWEDRTVASLEDILADEPVKVYYHPPLALKLSEYPDFHAENTSNFKPSVAPHPVEVQVDCYASFSDRQVYDVFLGTDIGSTSTKAVMVNSEQTPLAGFYTYTSGKPAVALQAIFEAINDLVQRKGLKITFRGAATTGSGRKFIGMLMNADLIVDEITAHARAACALNPDTDTIIEIGGQDSKFTLMKNGMVTFSQMNAVCAAGTGSFLEEQAAKLGGQLSAYSQRSEGVAAPLVSDRCTVFMERDTNQLLNKGYSENEILATTLHSVTENYLKKVAVEGSVGDHVCFQGATARNRSLVAAFEQRLGKKIFVSPYCHLTGALGAALLLLEKMPVATAFRGIDLFREHFEIRSESCPVCANRCHISLARINGKQEAYGLLCGRDYDSKRRVSPSAGVFNLPESRERIFSMPPPAEFSGNVVIGLPASLHLFEDLPLWKRFFANLSVKIVSSENFANPVKAGKRIAGAEFCAPIDSMYGHTAWLAGRSDHVFSPVSLQARESDQGQDRYYCYYTQFSAALLHTLQDKSITGKVISPMLDFSKGDAHVIRQLAAALRPILGQAASPGKVRAAFGEAVKFIDDRKKELRDLYKSEFQPENGISVVLLGRPYVVLSKTMNKGIPGIFAGMGIKAFFQDMIAGDERPTDGAGLLLRQIPWSYTVSVLEAAKIAAETQNLYPVLVTAFKCAPDSFIMEYFRKLLNEYQKPYLILQVDEHDSNVGYETRVEAAIRSFRNHSMLNKITPHPSSLQLLPKVETKVNGKTLLFPNWDNLVAPLLVANLKRSGIDARLMQSSETIIRKSMAGNTGQCLPVNIVAQEFIDCVEKNGLQPDDTMLWMTKCFVTCNLRLYPFHVKNLLESYGQGFENASVYYGDLTHLEIALSTGYHAYFAYLLGGLIRKLGCRIRPYEINKGETDDAIQKSIRILESGFLGNKALDASVAGVISLFDRIGRKPGKKPLVAIFGDLYVRDNDVMNQGLIHDIEEHGGEVITTPYSDLVKITIENVIRRAAARRDYFRTGLYRVMMSAIRILEDRYYQPFKKHLGEKPVVNPLQLEKHLDKFKISRYHSGESYENILKIFYILENYPDISLFVQTNPAFCCPALVTEAMAREIRRITGVPVVTLTYDGTSGNKNDVIVSYLNSLAVC